MTGWVRGSEDEVRERCSRGGQGSPDESLHKRSTWEDGPRTTKDVGPTGERWDRVQACSSVYA